MDASWIGPLFPRLCAGVTSTARHAATHRPSSTPVHARGFSLVTASAGFQSDLYSVIPPLRILRRQIDLHAKSFSLSRLSWGAVLLDIIALFFCFYGLGSTSRTPALCRPHSGYQGLDHPDMVSLNMVTKSEIPWLPWSASLCRTYLCPPFYYYSTAVLHKALLVFTRFTGWWRHRAPSTGK